MPGAVLVPGSGPHLDLDWSLAGEPPPPPLPAPPPAHAQSALVRSGSWLFTLRGHVPLMPLMTMHVVGHAGRSHVRDKQFVTRQTAKNCQEIGR